MSILYGLNLRNGDAVAISVYGSLSYSYGQIKARLQGSRNRNPENCLYTSRIPQVKSISDLTPDPPT